MKDQNKPPHQQVVGVEEELPHMLMRLLQYIDTGVPVSNGVANVAMIDQDLTELTVNIGNSQYWRMCHTGL